MKKKLTYRDKFGKNTGYPRYKIILDSHGKINANSKIFESKEKIIIFTTHKNNIKFKEDFEVDVYNSPFQFINRRNEITVSVISDF